MIIPGCVACPHSEATQPGRCTCTPIFTRHTHADSPARTSPTAYPRMNPRDAVEEDYYFQMYVDDLPIWGFIGKVERLPPAAAGAKKKKKSAAGTNEGGDSKAEEDDDDEDEDEEETKLLLFTHIHFELLYNEDRVIQVDISTGEGWGEVGGGRG
jgi:hypothetical protein